MSLACGSVRANAGLIVMPMTALKALIQMTTRNLATPALLMTRAMLTMMKVTLTRMTKAARAANVNTKLTRTTIAERLVMMMTELAQVSKMTMTSTKTAEMITT